jgi:hypothetical protein
MLLQLWSVYQHHSQNGPALGAQAGEARVSQVVKAGGFKHFKRATQTPFNIVYDARP